MSKNPSGVTLTFAGLAFALPLALYIWTLCPTVPVGDGGELICAAHGLGIAHPTGYPLYCLLGRIFTMVLPFGTVAWKVNLMSALFGALAAGMIFFLVKQHASVSKNLGRTPAALAALATALLFSVARTHWSQAVQSEVYTLHVFLVTALLLVMVRWRYSSDGRWAYLWAFLWGLALAHHTSAVFLGAPGIYLLAVRWRAVGMKGRLPGMILLFLVGISVYLYLPLRSLQDPFHDWGNPETLGRLYEHITARQYQGYFLLDDPLAAMQNLRPYLVSLKDQWGWIPLILGTAGAVAQFRFGRVLFPLFLLAFLGNVCLAVFYQIPDIEAYYLPSFVIFSLWIGLCLAAALKWLQTRRSGRVLTALMAVLLTALVLLSLTRNRPWASRRGSTIARDYGMNILRSVAPEAVLFASADNEAFPLLYLHHVEGMRPDVDLFDLGSAERMSRFLGIESAMGDDDPARLRRMVVDRTGRPVFFVKEHMSPKTDPLQIKDIHLEPAGLVYRLLRQAYEMSAGPGPWSRYTGVDPAALPREADYKTRMLVANYDLCRGEDLWVRGDSSAARAAFTSARAAIEKVAWAQVHNGMGVFFRRIGWLEGARLEFERALRCAGTSRRERSDLNVNLGNLEADQGRLEAAKGRMRQALQIWPENSTARFNLARLEANEHLRLGRYDRAAAEFEKMAAADPGNAVVWYNLGLIYAHRLHTPRRASECFRRYLELAPGGALASSAQAELERLRSSTARP
jgi:Tfp pilus assembly protein PilF